VATTALKTYWRHVYCHKYIFGDGVIAKQEVCVPYNNMLQQRGFKFCTKTFLVTLRNPIARIEEVQRNAKPRK
jgi:hypothetical protein